jgi:hypothetical protein
MGICPAAWSIWTPGKWWVTTAWLYGPMAFGALGLAMVLLTASS